MISQRLIEAVADAVIAQADELTALDQAIGDGDHGLNMKRGFQAIRDDAARLATLPLPEACTSIGKTLVMKVGGASGPLYGTLFLTLGKSLSPTPDLPSFAKAFTEAVASVQARGKSEEGQKTMLDVLAPVARALQQPDPDIVLRLPAIAAEAASATIPLRAIRGRASFLGDRSIGHMDPGARSAALMIAAACRAGL